MKSRNFNTKYGTVSPHLLVAAAITLGAHAHEDYSSQFICNTTLLLAHDVCNKMNVPANFVLNSEGFQLRDFAKKYSWFFIFAYNMIAKSASR